MESSRLEKLWEGTKPLQNLKKMVLRRCFCLKEIPDLSNATSLEILDLFSCTSLVELPSSIQNLIKLKELRMLHCSNLKVLPTDVNLESLDFLNLKWCDSLESFPQISRNIARLYLSDTAVKDCLWLENLSGLAELVWDGCLLRCMPSKFNTEHLVILKMRYSKLEKLWDGVQPLQSLKKMELNRSKCLKEIPDLSNATNLEILDLFGCTSLVALPSSIQNFKKLIALCMDECLNLKFLPVDVNLESLNSLRLKKCSRLQTFPRISRNISRLYLDGTAMTKKDCLWFKNFSRLTKLEWKYCPLRYVPSGFLPGYLVKLDMRDSKLEKLWEGDQPLENLEYMDLSRSKSLKEIPNLSKATNLRKLYLSYCTGLVALPSSIQYLDKLEVLEMKGCTSLEVLPTNIINLVSLNWLNLRGCSRLTSISKISNSIKHLWLDYTAIEEVPWIENFGRLTQMSISGCKNIRKIPATFTNLGGLWPRWLKDCQRKVKVSNASLVKTLVELHPARIEYYTETLTGVSRSTTEFLLARDAQEYIRKLDFIYGVIPGDQVPTYFTHRDRGASLSVPLPETESSLSTKKLAFAACINLDLPIRYDYITIFVHWKLGGVKGICRIIRGTNNHKLDHQLVFHFDFENGEEFDDPPSQLEFEFEAHRIPYYDFCGCYTFKGTSNDETCTIPPCNIEECGIRVLSVSPSLYEGNQQDGESDSERESFETEYADEESYTGSTESDTRLIQTKLYSFEPDYREQDGESDTESERSNEIEDSQKSREEIDAESGGRKPQLQMAVITSQEPSNLPSGQFPVAVRAPNLELSLGLSRVSRHFHGDETALNHSLPPSYPFLEAESLYFDPMIAEHDDTETISPQLINFFREEADAECGGSKQQLQTTIVTLCGQTAVDTGLMAPNLEFSLRLCGASESSDHVSFGGKVSSPSISMDANKTENQPNGESDAASERSKKRKTMTVISFQEPSNPPCGQTVEKGIQESSETEGGRSKKRMQMTVVTSQEPSNQEPSNQEPSNQPGSQSLVPKLDLSSGLCGASSSLPGDGTSLNPCLEKEALDDDRMITEQLDTEEKPSVKPSFTSWFPNIFRFWK